MPQVGSRLLSLVVMALMLLSSAATAQTNEWAWMGGSTTFGSLGSYGSLGIPATGNVPGERTLGCTWTDEVGNFWLLGAWASMAPAQAAI